MIRGNILDESNETYYPIRPYHIGTRKEFQGCMSEPAENRAARDIVLLCRRKGDHWTSFTTNEIVELVGSAADRNGLLMLVDEGYIVRSPHDPERFFVTHEFVCEVFQAEPGFGRLLGQSFIKQAAEQAAAGAH